MTKKKIQVYFNKTTTLPSTTLFCTFLSRRCTTATWNLLVSCALFMGYMNTIRTQKNVLFLFLNLDTVLSDSTQENFATIWQIKWNWIRSIKFATERILFSSKVFGLLSSRNVATMATWRNDLSLFQWDNAHQVIVYWGIDCIYLGSSLKCPNNTWNQTMTYFITIVDTNRLDASFTRYGQGKTSLQRKPPQMAYIFVFAYFFPVFITEIFH